MIATARRLFLVIFFLAVSTARTATAAAREPIAIVYEVQGEALLIAPGRSPQPVRLYERMAAGTAVEVAAGSRLALALVTGKRYEISGPARATLGKGDLAARSGGVRPLPSVPPLPRLSAIAEDDRPGAKAGAIRIRGEEIDTLSPHDGATTLAGETVLRFDDPGGALRHKIEIEDTHGTVIFRAVTENFAVSIPAGILVPGARYHWNVTAPDKPGPAARGEAGFVTLSRKAAEARERLRKAVEGMDDGSLPALLDAVDHGLGLTSEAPADPRAASGVVVETVAPGSPGEKAGVQPGDVILTWSCAASPPALPQPSGGTIRSPYDLLPVEIEEAPQRPVTLRGKRGGQELVWTLTAGEWGIEARPVLADDLAALYLEGKAKSEAGDLATVERSWRSVAESARSAGDVRLAAWFLNRLASAFAKAGQWPEADTAYEEALAALERESEHPAATAQLLHGWGDAFRRRGAWDQAVERYQRALALIRRTASRSLTEARTLNGLGTLLARKSDYPAAEELLLQALKIREELAPGTVEVTGSLNNLGILARRRGDLAASEKYLIRGEKVQRRLAPESADHALFFQNLGNLAMERGDLDGAGGFHRRALAMFEKTAPTGGGVEDCMNNLANVAMLRGDLAAADDLFRRSLALQERKAADELGLSTTLISLGNIASRRGDQEAAEAYYRRALAIQEKLSPDGWETAYSLGNLGVVAALRGDFATGRKYMQRALAIKERLAPEALDVATSLEQLGRLEMEAGSDLAIAEKLLRKALTIFEKEATENLDTAGVLGDLGEIAARRGNLPEAIAIHRRALDLQRKLAPETTGEAHALHLLGVAERQAGQQEGTRHLCQAIDILDRQRARIGGTQQARTVFEATLGDYYYDCVEGLIDLGRLAEAFQALERGRARSFLALLAERELRLSDLPPDLAAERGRVNAEYDRVQSQLARLSSGRDDAEIERLTGELRDLQTRQEEIFARIRQDSPRSSSLQNPEPLDLTGARAALDPGTVLLEYAVGPEKTWLFVVQPANAKGRGLSVFPIAAGAKDLREEVESLRRLMKRPGSDRASLQARSRRLYDLLVRPAAARIDGAQRLLISPDGPLHTLPFAALMRGDRYLIERIPVHTVLSATVYSELARSRPARREPGTERLAAFGDPSYPSSTTSAPADPEVGEAVRRGFSLKSLPSSRQEVEAIAALYPQTRAYLGREATEEKAKSLGPEARLVHFACHGLLDERFPLNSALALTLPEQQLEGGDNGLLQAWEIFESVRLDADLVTLSACDTGLGREMGGEGLVGLTRAFQYAGARTVLASLWSVSDVSTARFMQRFYGYLRSGKPKDESLRAAQIDQIREKSGSAHPFHWAAFELFGDWR